MLCKAFKTTTHVVIDAMWEKPPWLTIEPQAIDRYVGDRPKHCPKTQVKIAYDDAAVYVIFRVEDQYVRAVASEHNGKVWRDSCVEFFFTPCRNVSPGYFNMEVNCGGTTLLHFQQSPGDHCVHIPASECSTIQIAHSLPTIVDPEIQRPVTWIVEYRLPITLIQRYCHVEQPARGSMWLANFYKCGDATSQPHWLTWAPVDVQPPDFHRPEFFGHIEFQ